LYTENYIESRKAFLDPFYVSGKFVKYKRVGDTLYINKELGDYYSKLITKLNNDFKLFTNSPTYNRVFGDFVLEYTPESL
jgi:hypothetical protein